MREVFIMERNRSARDGWEFIHIEGALFDRGVPMEAHGKRNQLKCHMGGVLAVMPRQA